MSVQKRLLFDLAARLSAGDVDRVESWFSKDFRLHEPGVFSECTGHAGASLMLSRIKHSTPNVRVEVLDMVEEGDRVAVRWLFTATQEGTARQMSSVAIYRFTDGLISDDWGVVASAAWP